LISTPEVAEGAGARRVVAVLSLVAATLDQLPAVGVGRGYNIYLVMVQDPGCVGISAITVEEVLGKVKGCLRGAQLTAMDVRHQKEAGFGGWNLGVAEFEHQEVVSG
jgi:hypothetical protein